MTEQTANTWIVDILYDWALWAMDDICLGYPGKTPFAVERIQSGRGFVELSPEISMTDRAVARVRTERMWKWRVIQSKYLAHRSDPQIASHFGRTLDEARMMVWAAESAVAQHYTALEREAVDIPTKASNIGNRQVGSLARRKAL